MCGFSVRAVRDGATLFLGLAFESAMPKSWQQKLNSPHTAHVDVLTKSFAGLTPGARLYISHPLEFKQRIETLPEGSFMAVEALRAELARKHGADGACPLSSGIFVRIVAEAAFEELANGKPLNEITPFWRVVKADSKLAKKLACGTAFIEAMQAAEGIEP
jgi:hypothetical protein